MAASKRIGGINVSITATIAPFQRAMSAAQRALTSFGRAVKNTIFSMKGLAAALTGGLAVAGFVKLTKDAFGAIDAMKDLSDKLGVNTDKLKGLQLAADEAGIASNVLERALTVLSKTTGKAGDVALREWIEKTAKLTTHQQKLQAAVALFGMRGSSMVRMLEGGTAALDEAQAAAEKFGWAISYQAAAGVDRALEAIGRLKLALQGIFANVATELAPYIEVLTTKITDFMSAPGKIKSIGAGIAQAIISTAKFIADGIQKMVGGVLSMVAGVQELIIKFRGSSAGKAMGLGYDPERYTSRVGYSFARIKDGKFYPPGMYEETVLGVDTLDKAREAARLARNRAKAFGETPWSASIDSAVASARKNAASLPSFVSDATGLLSRIMSRAFTDAMTSAQAKLQNFGGPLFQLMGKSWLFGMTHRPGPKASSGVAPPLSMPESGSVESYRQQAAIRRQGENVQRKQLTAQERMLAQLQQINKKTMPVFEAGLA